MLLSGVLAWSLSRPIRLLHQAFGDAAAGRLDTRVSPRMGRRRDEFADLARDYDGMARQLQALLASQRRLLHDVSHELRSPLARMQVAAGLVRKLSHGDAAGLDHALDRIEREVLRLDSLVGEVLALARLSAGTSTAELADIDVGELLAAAADDAAFEARGCGRELVFGQDLPGVVMQADGELLRRAFDNVMRNAVKFSPVGGRVEVHAAFDAARSQLQVSVLDRGPGLPPEALNSVFEPFVRHQPDPGLPGFGLGLAIARHAAERHRGRLSAHAREGGGLQLLFELPVPPRAAPDGLNPI
jgi:two-component system OmpR family sensor kinase